MSESQAVIPAGIFDVYETDDDDDEEEVVIGKVECDAQGKLSVFEVDPERDAFLRDVLDRLNGKDAIAEIGAPPEGGERFGLGSTSVARGEPGFFDALQGYMTRYYGLRLG